ncbi:sulfite exporter TauE/SafE family protein [Morganella psychrotolerans]|uniref:sulfite exporter TauE/SafE family protein n=1 Tax=Morganella psychrotolerans TaxID=368603 RepID=UPI000A923FB5|nr:TSUP family transporter [Morganella psychrotolerans]
MYIEQSLMADYFYAGLALLVIASFIAGYIDSIAGGAGLILIPAFMLTGLPPHMALGQEKLVSSFGTLAAITNFIKNKSIYWQIIPAGIVSSFLGAWVGAKAIIYLPAETITYIIICMLPLGLLAAFFKGRLGQAQQNSAVRKSVWLVFFTCFIVGFYDGFFGPGTGSIFIICLFLINNLDLLKSSATSKIFNLASNIGGLVAFIMAGHIAFLISIPMIAASLLGNHLGSNMLSVPTGKLSAKFLS